MDMNTKPLAPNTTPFPSEPWNDPVMWPFVGMEGHRFYISDTPLETGIGSPIGEKQFSDQSAADNLRALRLQFPFLEVIPVPARAVSVSLAANTPTEVVIPDGMVAIIMRGNADYYVSFNGAAGIPVAIGNNQSLDTQSIYKPEGYLMYVGNKRAFSVIAPNAGTIVTFMCYPLVPINPA